MHVINLDVMNFESLKLDVMNFGSYGFGCFDTKKMKFLSVVWCGVMWCGLVWSVFQSVSDLFCALVRSSRSDCLVWSFWLCWPSGLICAGL